MNDGVVGREVGVDGRSGVVGRGIEAATSKDGRGEFPLDFILSSVFCLFFSFLFLFFGY